MQASRKDRALEFSFDNILLPDSNRNEPSSHGFVRYRIKAVAGVAENTVVENKAHIFFDFNPAIETNTTFNTLVATLPQREINGLEEDPKDLEIYPNPTRGSLQLKAPAPIYEIRLYNALGQLVKEQKLVEASPELGVSIDDLPPGIYLINIRAGKQQYRQRLIKQ